MEAIYLIYAGILLLMICLVLTVLFLIVYSGLFHSIDIGAGKPPMEAVVVAYKFARGPYKDCGQLFTETLALAPDHKTLGIYYDNPKEVLPSETRYAVGSILAEGNQEVDNNLKSKFIAEGYMLRNFPYVTNAVKTSFPHKCTLSIFIAVARVYPRLSAYITDNKLCAHPFIEIYDGETIQFMAPLSRQEDFYVPEIKTPPADDSIPSDGTCTDISSLSERMEESLSPVTGVSSVISESADPIEIPSSSSSPLPCELLPGMGENVFSETQKFSEASTSLNDSGISSENAQVPDSSLDGPGKSGGAELASDHSTESVSSFEEIHMDAGGL